MNINTLPTYMLKRWFELYDYWVVQALRAQRLNITWTQEDKLLNTTYTSVRALDNQAELVRKEIKARAK